MENEWEKAYRLSAEQLAYGDKYSYSILEEQRKMMIETMKRDFENQFLQQYRGGIGLYLDDVQRTKDMTATLGNGTHRVVLEALDYLPELVMRVSNVTDITQLSHDVRSSCVHGVHLKYERQQNHLDIYFEKAQDYVLVKMFTE